MNQHDIRRAALQANFIQLSSELTAEQALETVKDHYLNEEETLPDYLEQLVKGVASKKDELNQVIDDRLSDKWQFNRIAKINIAILQLALYELKYTETPTAVAINEALNLADEFSDDKSKKFINGLLSNFSKQ
ncbi:transcription antitermination factor NusB [Holzapfeliella sp. He02]|uniref:Transcription antitermination protein NusB n=1 Tax=Holzapfeliella saturejae TaxID=3082953 RepID=A0ABU8SI50_9LACO